MIVLSKQAALERITMIPCRRCGGFMRLERDQYSSYTACIICGNVVENMPPAPLDDREPVHENLDPSVSAQKRRDSQQRYERRQATTRKERRR